MQRRLRMKIPKSQQPIVFVNHVRLDLAGSHFAE
jgi:hypothetical protein